MADSLVPEIVDEEAETAHPRRHFRRYWWVYVILASPLLLLLLLVVGVRATLWMTGAKVYLIPTPAMQGTFQIGDRVLVKRIPGYVPAIGDIVVFRAPEIIPRYDPAKAIYIKRIAALGGNEIEIMEDGSIQVNGKELESPDIFLFNKYYQTIPGYPKFTKAKVPDGEVFVLGDNSANSYDSRCWGRPDLGRPIVGVPVENIMGKAVSIVGGEEFLTKIVDKPAETRQGYRPEQADQVRD